MSIEKIIERIRRNNNFLITAHTNLEGDALGSEIALYRLLKKLGKRAWIINDDTIPYGYEFLKDTKEVINFGKRKVMPGFDCLVVLDCSNLSRAGRLESIDLAGKEVINIDHHISNEKFGDINWVEPAASSTSEMIYKVFKKMRLSIDRETAAALYCGILTDTGSFKYANTTGFTHRVAADLIDCGIKVKQIYNYIYEKVPYSDMELLSKIFPKMKNTCNGKVVWFEVEAELLKGRKVLVDLTDYVLSFGRRTKDAQVIALFKENLGDKSEVRVNFRSQGKIDVNKIASFFGGGGHKTASGATIQGSLAEVRRRVLDRIKREVDKICK